MSPQACHSKDEKTCNLSKKNAFSPRSPEVHYHIIHSSEELLYTYFKALACKRMHSYFSN